MRQLLASVAGSIALLLSGTASAAIILDQSNTISDGLPTGVTVYNAVYTGNIDIGQLRVGGPGAVRFEYLGNEASYTNEFRLFLGTTLVFSTSGDLDVFADPGEFSPWFDVSAGYIPFSLCTDGGSMDVIYGGCVDNSISASIKAQWFLDGTGYRSIGFHEEANGSWLIFWDDSGNNNDDDYNDLIARVYFVPEPGTLALLGLGLMGLGFASRRRKV